MQAVAACLLALALVRQGTYLVQSTRGLSLPSVTAAPDLWKLWTTAARQDEMCVWKPSKVKCGDASYQFP